MIKLIILTDLKFIFRKNIKGLLPWNLNTLERLFFLKYKSYQVRNSASESPFPVREENLQESVNKAPRYVKD